MKRWLYLDHPALKLYPATPHILIHRPLRFISITRHNPCRPFLLGILNNTRLKQTLKILGTHALALSQGRSQSLTDLRIICTRLQIMWRGIRVHIVKHTLRHCAYIKEIPIKIGISHSGDFFHILFHIFHKSLLLPKSLPNYPIGFGKSGPAPHHDSSKKLPDHGAPLVANFNYLIALVQRLNPSRSAAPSSASAAAPGTYNGNGPSSFLTVYPSRVFWCVG